jgi:ferrous iron transport protein A
MRKLSNLRKGEKGVIVDFTDKEISLKLLEMGCLPGTEVKLTAIAPLGDPLCIKLSGYCLSLRKEEAETIVIT